MKKMTKEAIHDTRLLELYGELAKAEGAYAAKVERAFRAAAWKPLGTTKVEFIDEHGAMTSKLRTELVPGELVRKVMFARGKRREEIRTVTEEGTRPAELADLPERYRAEIDPFHQAMMAAHGAVREHEADYTGWDRYWLVTTSNGHVHADRACHTLRPTTGLALVPVLSAKTAAEAIDLLGNTMCTVCFPDAPVDPVAIPATIAVVLMAEGEDAFLKAMTKHTEAKAKRVKCAGGGTRNYEAQRFPNGALRKYQRCEDCGAAVTVTTIGALRAHTPAS